MSESQSTSFAKPSLKSAYWRYWGFYWPLMLTSVVMQSETFFQNRALAKFSADAREIAVFANAAGIYQSFAALLIFIPQVITLLAVNRDAERRCQKFVVFISCLLALPLFLFAYTNLGETLASIFLAVPTLIMDDVQGYLRWLAPLIIIDAQIFHNVGRLIAAQKNRVLTQMNLLHLVIVVAGLQIGNSIGASAVNTLAVATVSANLAHLIWSQIAARNTRNQQWDENAPPATYRELWAFYFPMALTGIMFALSRPIIYRYVNFLPPAQALATVAALRVAFDAGFIFQAPVNQMRNLFTSFPNGEQPAIRRFSLWVASGYCVIICAVAFTPLSRYFFGNLLGLHDEVLTMTIGAFAILSLNPVIIAIRNIYHGELMTNRHTGGMAVGAAMRIAIIGLCAYVAFRLGWLNHLTGAALMLSGFVIETLTAYIAAKRLRIVLPSHKSHA